MSDKGYQIPRDSNSPEAQSLTENETQKHNFRGRENEAGSEHSQSPDFPKQGENDKRVSKKTEVAERHIQSKPGLEVAKERAASIEKNRKASAAVFDAHRRHTSARVRGNKS